MSHFTVIVIGEDWERQLAPYNEAIEVPEYSTGIVTEKEWEDFRKYYTEKYPEKSELSDEKLYGLYGENWNGKCWRRVQKIWYSFSTYNPKSKWDWYVIGGRWTGYFKLRDGAPGIVGRPGVITKPAPPNTADQAKIRDVEKILTPFACVKDGQWYERGQMGWWAIVSDEKEQEAWEQEFCGLLKGLPEDTLLTMIDAHI